LGEFNRKGQEEKKNLIIRYFIEKAYAKLNFNYNALTKIYLRQAINEFTGLEPEILTFTKGKKHKHPL